MTQNQGNGQLRLIQDMNFGTINQKQKATLEDC